MPNTEEPQELTSALENYAEQLIVEAYASGQQNTNDELSDAVLKELADRVERCLLVALKAAAESTQNSMESIPD